MVGQNNNIIIGITGESFREVIINTCKNLLIISAIDMIAIIMKGTEVQTLSVPGNRSVHC